MAPEATGKLAYFLRHDCDSDESLRVMKIAHRLADDIATEETSKQIAAANVIGRASHEVQACIVDQAKALGFQSEKKGLFTKYKTANLRPDYYLRITEGRGIILEVERGKTLANNMDLLDLWKCHICDEAQYLFLMVPMERPNQKGGKTKVFSKVAERLEPFFLRENYVRVNGLFIIGY